MSTPSKEAPQTTKGVPGPRADAETDTGLATPEMTAGTTEEMTTDMTADMSEDIIAETAPQAGPMASIMTATATKVVAMLRMALGAIFAWAFLDKVFGLGYSTPKINAWIDGGSPTRGFLSGAANHGPFQAMFRSMAGQWWVDWSFMLALAGLGALLLFGIGLRIAAIGGTILMAMMWMVEWPPDKFTNAGAPSGSTNPLIDEHVIYALVMISCAALYAGNRWGLGRRWSQLGFVQRNRWLI